MYNTTPAPDQTRSLVWYGGTRRKAAPRPADAEGERPEPEDRYHPAPARSAYTDEVWA